MRYNVPGGAVRHNGLCTPPIPCRNSKTYQRSYDPRGTSVGHGRTHLVWEAISKKNGMVVCHMA